MTRHRRCWRQFAKPENCQRFLEQLRWPGGPGGVRLPALRVRPGARTT